MLRSEIHFEGLVIQMDVELGFTPFEVESCPILDFEHGVVGHKIQTIPGFVLNDEKCPHVPCQQPINS